MIQLDHLAVEARDVAASARFLADILGLADPVPEGEDDDMFRIDLDHGVFVLFSPASEPRFYTSLFASTLLASKASSTVCAREGRIRQRS
ncbi:hypothetical protein [Nannocystis pusilla]|uniref:hypothetical protein n=1 Tax=Nannocystis pusilla TaxID=889268 RepID=UPI003B7C961B